MIIEETPLLDEILSEWEELLGDEHLGYKNHAKRMILFCFAIKNKSLNKCTEEDKQKIIIAAAFHDIGIWIDDTLDYLPPSLPPAQHYLNKMGLEAWTTEIELMITEHHKFRKYKNKDYPLVEVFRRGDLVDFSLGVVTFGLDKADIKQVKSHIPNANFHKNLAKRFAKWIIKHPLKPAPMLKW